MRGGGKKNDIKNQHVDFGANYFNSSRARWNWFLGGGGGVKTFSFLVFIKVRVGTPSSREALPSSRSGTDLRESNAEGYRG